MIIKRYTVGGWRNVVIGGATLKTVGPLLSNNVPCFRFHVEGPGHNQALASVTVTAQELREMLAAIEGNTHG